MAAINWGQKQPRERRILMCKINTVLPEPLIRDPRHEMDKFRMMLPITIALLTYPPAEMKERNSGKLIIINIPCFQ